jgi:selenium metabolism protein YedF
LGQGSEELGRLLMRGFLYALTERETVPERVILMNSGVRLAASGSESLVNLKKLGERGVEILVCGTCVEYFGLKADLALGRISNMYEIAGYLMEEGTLRI